MQIVNQRWDVITMPAGATMWKSFLINAHCFFRLLICKRICSVLFCSILKRNEQKNAALRVSLNVAEKWCFIQRTWQVLSSSCSYRMKKKDSKHYTGEVAYVNFSNLFSLRSYWFYFRAIFVAIVFKVLDNVDCLMHCSFAYLRWCNV